MMSSLELSEYKVVVLLGSSCFMTRFTNTLRTPERETDRILDQCSSWLKCTVRRFLPPWHPQAILLEDAPLSLAARVSNQLPANLMDCQNGIPTWNIVAACVQENTRPPCLSKEQHQPSCSLSQSIKLTKSNRRERENSTFSVWNLRIRWGWIIGEGTAQHLRDCLRISSKIHLTCHFIPTKNKRIFNFSFTETKR